MCLLIFIGRFVCHSHNPLLPAFLLFSKHTMLHTQHGHTRAEPGARLTHSTGYNPSTARQVQGKGSTALSFLCVFCNLVETQLFQKPAHLPVRYLHSTLQCYLIDTRSLHFWTTSSCIILQQSKTLPLEKDAAQVIFMCLSEQNTNIFV